MAVTADKPAPYTAPSAILDVIDRYRNRGLPAPINADVLGRAGVSQGLIPRTIQALQTLELIGEDGKPTKTFEGIRVAPEAEYKKRLEEWLKAVYADVFAFVDPTTDEEIQIRDAFRTYQPVGQQSRMVTLFQGLCAAAGLVSEKAPPQSRAPTARTAARAIPRKPANTTASKSNSAASIAAGIPAPLAGLLSSLPAEGRGWTADRRKKFLDTFGTVLDFCFPIVAHEADEQDEAPP